MAITYLHWTSPAAALQAPLFSGLPAFFSRANSIPYDSKGCKGFRAKTLIIPLHVPH
jgi:hypothetical protein